jgi:hypothetical protein
MRAAPYLLSLMLGLCALPACKGDKADGGDEKTEAEAGDETATEESSAASATPFTGVRAVLDGYEAVLQDPKGDVVGEAGAAFDLTSSLAVASEDSLLIRISSAEPMTLSNATDVRLWLEQEGKMLTIEAKPDHPQRICELTPVGGSESEEIVGCLHLAQHFDIRIPGANLPDWLDRNKPYFISGVSTCCQDESREKPYDEIDGAQEVWVN